MAAGVDGDRRADRRGCRFSQCDERRQGKRTLLIQPLRRNRKDVAHVMRPIRRAALSRQARATSSIPVKMSTYGSAACMPRTDGAYPGSPACGLIHAIAADRRPISRIARSNSGISPTSRPSLKMMTNVCDVSRDPKRRTNAFRFAPMRVPPPQASPKPASRYDPRSAASRRSRVTSRSSVLNRNASARQRSPAERQGELQHRSGVRFHRAAPIEQHHEARIAKRVAEAMQHDRVAAGMQTRAQRSTQIEARAARLRLPSLRTSQP